MNEQDFLWRTRGMKQKLYRVSCAMLRIEADREDAISEAILRGYARMDQLRDDALFETWLIRILINECRTIQRRHMRDAAPLNESVPAPEPPDPALYEALMALPETYRLVLTLHYIEGYSTKEVAAQLRVPRGTVLWRLSRARMLMKDRLEVGE